MPFLNQEHPYHYKLDLTKFTDVNQDLASNRYFKLPWVNEREEILKNRALFGKMDAYQLKSYTNSTLALELDLSLKYDLWTRINISGVEIVYELLSGKDQTCLKEGSIQLNNQVEANLNKFTLICNINMKQHKLDFGEARFLRLKSVTLRVDGWPVQTIPLDDYNLTIQLLSGEQNSYRVQIPGTPEFG